MDLAEFLQNEILGKVRVLILIHHDIVKTAGHGSERLLVISEQDIHIQQDIIEIHNAGLFAFGRIQSIDIADFRLLRMSIIGNGLIAALVGLRRDKIVLRHRNAAQHILRLVNLVIKFQFLKA